MGRKLAEKLKAVKKEQYVVALLLGVLFLIIALPVKRDDENTETVSQSKAQSQETDKQKNMQECWETDLEQLLAQVEGVGKVRVILTLETSGEKIVEKDTPVSTSLSQQTQEGGSTEKSSSEDTREETVFEKDGSGQEVPYVVSELSPRVRGVLVVAEGGDNPVVAANIGQAVKALFGVEAHKIKVMKMK